MRVAPTKETSMRPRAFALAFCALVAWAAVTVSGPTLDDPATDAAVATSDDSVTITRPPRPIDGDPTYNTTTTAPPTTATPPVPATTLPPTTAPVQISATSIVAPPPPPPAGPGTGCAIPEYVCQRESGGNPMAVNPTGCGGEGCYGKYQFAASTWNATVTAMGRPDLVGNFLPDEATQDAVAAYLWAGGAGCGHWAAC